MVPLWGQIDFLESFTLIKHELCEEKDKGIYMYVPVCPLVFKAPSLLACRRRLNDATRHSYEERKPEAVRAFFTVSTT